MATRNIKDFLPLYYGCRVILTESDNQYDVPTKGTVLDLNAHLLMQCLSPEPFLHCKPILKKLETITDEHAIELQKKFKGEFSAFVFVHSLSRKLLPGSLWSISEISAAINQLRKWGYDCDELIYDNLAIDERVLNKTKDGLEVTDGKTG